MRSLDTMILDEMIEQYNRFNPVPNPDDIDRPTIKQQMESQMVVSLLTELQALRPRCSLYETRIVHLNQDLNNKNNEIDELKRRIAELEKVKHVKRTR